MTGFAEALQRDGAARRVTQAALERVRARSGTRKRSSAPCLAVGVLELAAAVRRDAAHDRGRQLVAVAEAHVGRALAAHDRRAVERARERAAVGAHEAADAEVGAAVPAHDDGCDVVQARAARAPPGAARRRCRRARRRRSRRPSRRAAGRPARRASGCGARAPRAAKKASAPAPVGDRLGDRQEARAALLEFGRDAAGERAERVQRGQPRLGYLERASSDRDDQQGGEGDAARPRRAAGVRAARARGASSSSTIDAGRSPRRRSARRCARPSRCPGS